MHGTALHTENNPAQNVERAEVGKPYFVCSFGVTLDFAERQPHLSDTYHLSPSPMDQSKSYPTSVGQEVQSHDAPGSRSSRYINEKP